MSEGEINVLNQQRMWKKIIHSGDKKNNFKDSIPIPIKYI